MDAVVAPELTRTGAPAPGRTLAVVAASTVLTLAAFVTPLATCVRTAADLGTGAAGQAWLLSAMSVGLAAALLVAGVAADDLGQRRVFAGGLGLLAAGAAAAARLALPSSGPRRHRRVDVAGTVLLVAALSCLLAGLVETRAPSGAGVATVVLVVAGV